MFKTVISHEICHIIGNWSQHYLSQRKKSLLMCKCWLIRYFKQRGCIKMRTLFLFDLLVNFSDERKKHVGCDFEVWGNVGENNNKGVDLWFCNLHVLNDVLVFLFPKEITSGDLFESCRYDNNFIKLPCFSENHININTCVLQRKFKIYKKMIDVFFKQNNVLWQCMLLLIFKKNKLNDRNYNNKIYWIIVSFLNENYFIHLLLVSLLREINLNTV